MDVMSLKGIIDYTSEDGLYTGKVRRQRIDSVGYPRWIPHQLHLGG
jgi:hypothetical protein